VVGYRRWRVPEAVDAVEAGLDVLEVEAIALGNSFQKAGVIFAF